MSGWPAGVVALLTLAVAAFGALVTFAIVAAAGPCEDATDEGYCAAGETKQWLVAGIPFAVVVLGMAWSLARARLTPVLLAAVVSWATAALGLGLL